MRGGSDWQHAGPSWPAQRMPHPCTACRPNAPSMQQEQAGGGGGGVPHAHAGHAGAVPEPRRPHAAAGGRLQAAAPHVGCAAGARHPSPHCSMGGVSSNAGLPACCLRPVDSPARLACALRPAGAPSPPCRAKGRVRRQPRERGRHPQVPGGLPGPGGHAGEALGACLEEPSSLADWVGGGRQPPAGRLLSPPQPPAAVVPPLVLDSHRRRWSRRWRPTPTSTHFSIAS